MRASGVDIGSVGQVGDARDLQDLQVQCDRDRCSQLILASRFLGSVRVYAHIKGEIVIG